MSDKLAEWMKGWDWQWVDDYQTGLGTSICFRPEDRGLFKDALSFGEKFFEAFDFMPKHQSIYVIPADTEEGEKDIVPVMGWTGCVPGSDIPEQHKKEASDWAKPHGLKYQEKIVLPSGRKVSPWDLAADRLRTQRKYHHGDPSVFMSHTDLSLHKPNYPAMAVWEFDFSGKGWDRRSMNVVHAYMNKAQKLIPEQRDRIFFRTKGNRLRMFIFAERPDADLTLKESMFMGHGRVRIMSNRSFPRGVEESNVPDLSDIELEKED